MTFLTPFLRLFLHLRYPSLPPCEVAKILGLKVPTHLNLHSLISQLKRAKPAHLQRFMFRKDVEKFFSNAIHADYFPHETLYSYYFKEGWLEVVLHFDLQSRLRRIYVQHPLIKDEEGVEIQLAPGL